MISLSQSSDLATLNFIPHPKQREYLESTAEELLFSGAFGASKSTVLVAKTLTMAARYPGLKSFIVRKHLSSLKMTTMQTWNSFVPAHMIRYHNKSEHTYVIESEDWTDPSFVTFTGMDDPLKKGSLEAGLIGIDEMAELSETDYLMLSGRLRQPGLPFYQLHGATNPAHPQHYLYRRFFADSGLPRDTEQVKCIHACSADNPDLPEATRRRYERFTGLYRQRWVLGQWIGFEGLVYPTYNPATHEVSARALPIGDDWPRFISVDFGYVHPACVVWFAHDQERDILVRYRVLYQTGLTTADLATQVARYSEQDPLPAWICTDHDADSRASWVKQWNRAGAEPCEKRLSRVQFLMAEKAISQGIQAVSDRLQVDENTGLPRILFLSNALCHPPDQSLLAVERPTSDVEEFGGYQWKRVHGGYAEVPDKARGMDDGMDAIRYAVYTHAKRQQSRGRGGFRMGAH